MTKYYYVVYTLNNIFSATMLSSNADEITIDVIKGWQKEIAEMMNDDRIVIINWKRI